MSEPGFIKCPCRHCGGRIEFPTQAIGMTVDCPHCGQKTLLGRAASTTTPAAAPAAPAAPAADGSSARRPYVLLAAVCGLLAVGGGIWWWLQREPAAPPPPAQPASFKGKMAAMESAEATGTPSTPPTPPAPAGKARPKSIDDLKAGPVTLEKARSGSLVYAVGTLRNESDLPRYGVRIEIGLTDASGVALRVATDYTQTMEPRAEWRFRALVLDAKATAGKVVSIKEEP
jgi:DNA-directed RNA polymerase subunit RPC12/RpoP